MKDNSSLNISNLASFAKLERFLESRRDPSSKESELNFEEFEVRVDRLSHELQSEIKALELSRYDVEATSISINGELLRKCLEKEPKRYMTASGPIAVERRLYRSRGGGKSICPLELRAGIVGGVYTPVLARQMTYMMGNMISVETSKLFDERNIEGPSSSSCDRLPKMVSERWEEYRREWEDALREQETAPAEATHRTGGVAGRCDGGGQRRSKRSEIETRRGDEEESVQETCNNPDTPENITDYEVHGAARSDVGKAPDILDRLEQSERSPEKLFVDGGYPTVESAYDIIEQRGIALVAPVHRGPMDAAVMGRTQFEFDEEGHVVSCPEGLPAIDRKRLSNNATARTLHAVFDGDTYWQCAKLEICSVRAPNHRKKGDGPRETSGNFRLEITPELRLRDDMLEKQQTDKWKEDDKIRSGVEATMSLKRGYGMARRRVRGLSRVHFAVVCNVIACNIKRWWRASRPFGADNTPRSTGLPTPLDIFWMRLCSMLRGTNPKSEYIHVIPQKICCALKLAA